MGDVEWTNESVVALIEEYKRRRELWDKEHDLYRVQTAKYEAWASIARLFECEIADVRKKFNSILASHRREKAKVRSGGRSNWFLYPYLNFLSNHLEQNDEYPTRPMETEQQQSSEDQGEEEYLEEEREVRIKKEPVQTFVRTRTFPPLRSSKRLTRTVGRKIVRESNHSSSSILDSRMIEMLKLLKKSEMSKKKDECDTFGEYIAMTLRKHDERTQSMIKQAINNILFEQEMKKYSTQYATVVLATEENPLLEANDNTP